MDGVKTHDRCIFSPSLSRLHDCFLPHVVIKPLALSSTSGSSTAEVEQQQISAPPNSACFPPAPKGKLQLDMCLPSKTILRTRNASIRHFVVTIILDLITVKETELYAAAGRTVEMQRVRHGNAMKFPLL